MNKIIESIKIKEEDELRKILENHPLSKKLMDFALKKNEELPYENAIKVYLKWGIELTPKTHKNLFQLVDKVLKHLEIKPTVRIFKVKDTGFENAYIINNEKRDEVIIAFCDNILNLIESDAELLSIIGHEMGHYIYNHLNYPLENYILSFYQLTTDDLSEEEAKLINKEEFSDLLSIASVLSQIRELNADRIGLLVCDDFASTMTSTMKLTAGPTDRFGKYDINTYLEQSEHLLQLEDIFDKEDIHTTHPVEPLRVKALEAFYHSDLYKNYHKKGHHHPIKKDDFSTLLKKFVPIDYIYQLLETRKNDKHKKLDPHDVSLFKLYAVFYIISADGKITKSEDRFLANVVHSKKVYEEAINFINDSSIEKLNAEFSRLCQIASKYDKRTKTSIIKLLIKAAKADRKVTQAEIEIIYQIAENFDAAEEAKKQMYISFGVF